LTDEEWASFEPFVCQANGRPVEDHRRTLNAVFWIARTGAPQSGLWDLMLDAVAEGGSNSAVQMANSTVIRAHHCAAGARGGLKTRLLAARAPRTSNCNRDL
jgi:transposase